MPKSKHQYEVADKEAVSVSGRMTFDSMTACSRFAHAVHYLGIFVAAGLHVKSSKEVTESVDLPSRLMFVGEALPVEEYFVAWATDGESSLGELKLLETIDNIATIVKEDAK